MAHSKISYESSDDLLVLLSFTTDLVAFLVKELEPINPGISTKCKERLSKFCSETIVQVENRFEQEKTMFDPEILCILHIDQEKNAYRASIENSRDMIMELI